MNIDQLLQELWNQYSDSNPSVKKIHALFEAEGETIINDHIAFRTFNDPRTGIEVLSKPFLKNGFKESGSYNFPAKKLRAKHYEKEGYPRVFISELLMEEFSEDLQKKVLAEIDGIKAELLGSDQLVFSGAVFASPSYKTYESLRSESEYAAWVYAFGYRANHFTISINHLKKLVSIEMVNDFLKQNGFELNTSGGEIKGTPDQLLEQSSTLADRIKVEFKEGLYSIPSCYYEFARRYPDANGRLFSGFIANSADKIFESTDMR